LASDLPLLFRVPRSAFRVSSRRLQKLRHLIGSSQRRDIRPWHDAPQQPGEHVARADFDEPRVRALTCELCRALHTGHPADRCGELVGEQAARAGRVANGLRCRVRDHRERRIAERRVLERYAQLIGRGGHERGMKRATHLERDHPFGSPPFAGIAGPDHRVRVAGSAPAVTYAEYSPSECPAAATAGPEAAGPTTANTAALCARIAGCAL